MLERVQDVPAGIDAVTATGMVGKDEYERVVVALIDDARRDGRRIRLLFELGPEFRGFTPAAGWEDLKVGIRSLRSFEGCAIVTDAGWVRESTRLLSWLTPCPVRVFGTRERPAALDWLRSLPEGPGVAHHLIPDAGVIVVEVAEPLRAQDFSALATTADSWLASHDRLNGVVMHAHTFPGWENLGGLLQHMRFVRDHHRRIGRVAVAADSVLTDVAPHLANHFVQAEIRHFGYDELDAAIAWASAPPARH
ncbi:STAS/SEC14 domain-containing protein [Dactylosporangium aurantiacum]|uniref:STAS/SEC14 domain-containing protein n=1 Tax=Dactylosporangium aurantiacum TaxID=35754 RepID=A0A9Q9IB45_9ACTN|nr:STAS/SEC14 domain-containing protein [Dactylosporangium aurantiacum]MDG6107319.1 STAS/SEC14 domain-containing protein [Dactylosporangium aurantiacum]UWZ51155.1 STAS/SEC14 domain-containing protein [Dactylosporangium aurantiacum]